MTSRQVVHWLKATKKLWLAYLHLRTTRHEKIN
jgi:hypothetical protein